MSRSYQLVLFADAQAEDGSGYVFCADDDRARDAAESLLRKRPALMVVHVYDGERLVWQIVRDGEAFHAVG